jgi:hypothetical protein
MTTSKRLILWSGDGPLNARDQVVGYIETMIDEALREVEQDTCWLNELMAYFRCLNGVLREAGGEHLVSQRVTEWRERALAAFDAIPRLTPHEIRDDRSFIVSVFDDLDELTKP